MNVLPFHKKSRIINIVIICILVLLISFGVWWYFNKVNKTSIKTTDEVDTTTQESETKPTNKDKVVHFAAMGDMLAHDTIIANAKTDSGYDFGKYFGNIRDSYKNADVIFCDQEGLVSGEKYGISGYPSFNAPTQFASGLKSGAGCNFINLANNHIGDKGVDATNATIDAWNAQKPLAITGANKSSEDQEKVSYMTINDIKISFLAFADFNNNNSTPAYSVNNYHDEALLNRLVTTARVNSDVVIVSMHWGTEDSSVVDDEQKAFANLLSSLGVDVIIGTGPHVLQSVNTIARDDGGKTVVWYSIGNMLSSQLYIKELIGGIAQFDITKTAAGIVTVGNLSFIPTYMHYEWTASEAANGDLLARKNATIYLLNDAAEPLAKSLLNTTVVAQKQYVVDTIGAEVTVK